MEIIRSISELQKTLDPARQAGKTVGLVPTMGFLHEGHLSMVRAARDENDVVVLSIFVNPTQFGPAENYQTYPRDLARDTELAEQAGADIIFAPEVQEVYPDGLATYVEVTGPETKGLCATSRPGHFRGVTTVVAKLLNIVRPERAYFGQKDAQQLAVIKRMMRDLNIPVEVIGCPTVREPDGLAMSSRNMYLKPEERKAAAALHEALIAAETTIKQGERSGVRIIDAVEKVIKREPLAKLEYAEIRQTADFSQPEMIDGEVLLAVAAKVGQTRLIDNIVVNSDE
ncbi:MAG: pantoate--beta-alanine ligase [Actinomycetota bacterium]